MDRSWDTDPAHALSVTGGFPSDLTPEHLPEVERLRGEGWFVLPDAPMWSFLPSIWPPDHRAWVYDRSTRYMEVAVDGEVSVVPHSREVRDAIDMDTRETLRQAGVDGWRPNRIWLLRCPRMGDSLDDVLDALCQAAERQGVVPVLRPEFVGFAARWVHEAFTADNG